MRLYRLRPPAEGENSQYEKALKKLSHTDAPIELHPGIGDMDFDRALAEDALALRAAEFQISADYDQVVQEAMRFNAEDNVIQVYFDASITSNMARGRMLMDFPTLKR